MPKKKSTSAPQPEPKKPQVMALKKNTATPALDAQEKIEASLTPEIEKNPSVVSDSSQTSGAEVESSDAQLVTEIPTPGVEVKVLDAQPSVELKTVLVEVNSDAPDVGAGAKSGRPVLKKKSDRLTDVEASSEATTTPELLEVPPDGAIFQAVGIIVGDVTFSDERKAKVAIGGKEYPLFYAPQKKKAYYALEQQVKVNGSHQRLMVYPRVIHFPKREEPHQIAFQLVGFFRTERDANPEEITSQLGDFEFKLAGLWQFIPVCQTPCITILKNYTEERKDFIKEADLALKVKFMKASHVPVLWRDAPVRPFRFNPKAPKENQGNPAFVQLKAAFVPDKGVFEVLALTSTPAIKAPRFLKARKEDKLQVASNKLRAAKAAKGGKAKPPVVKK